MHHSFILSTNSFHIFKRIPSLLTFHFNLVFSSLSGSKETNKDTNPFLTRFKNWGDWPFDFPCGGTRVRNVCIFSIRDLPLLSSRPEMFANKFFSDYNPLAYDCMEQRHFNITLNEVIGNSDFDDDYYKHLDFVLHHV